MEHEATSNVVDADVLMSLIATGRTVEIVGAVGPMLLCPQVEGETLYLESDTEPGTREVIDLQPLIDLGALQRVTLDDAELNLFVDLAAAVDDGEAQVIAVAIQRGLSVATDDRRARRVASERGARVDGTPEILKRWRDASGVPTAEVRAAIERVERLAHYRPRRDHPLAEWWENPSAAET